MAQSELEIKLTWENNISFEMTSKKDAGDVKTVVKIDENSHLTSIWPSIHAICQTYFQREITDIGNNMKG